ncbi:Hypothetical protein, DUF285 family [Mycoplasmopsis agalactiae 14628]|uniref:Lipoprotein n=1 Tax=Mycoplasmopsis agalactiae 14628 TaxID=1110504 RepID=I5D548_MYCAA|nr:BspA family leucine-rich repeat surface protein [Mycoplasmopsis agalactiae]EIN14807.1 Hypothetical protein, DUF285 family [Mycoplasmopsis agalactiae 14628]
METEEEKKANKENAEKVKKIVGELKDAFATFHSLQDFYDQVNVYAKEEKINNLELAETNKSKFLIEDNRGGKNKIKLKLGSTVFEVALGSVLKDKVVTKYTIERNDSDLRISNDNKFEDLNKSGKKIFIRQIGYSLKDNVVTIATMPKNTVEVPKNLPLKIQSLRQAFYQLNSSRINNIEKWNITNVSDISEAFSYASEFNQDVSSWNTTNVRNMAGLFADATKFNMPLNSWDVSNVRQMSNLFAGAAAFNQDLNSWNTENVIDMESMFHTASSFNGNIDNWNVKNVNTMSEMFAHTESFNKDLSKWKLNPIFNVVGMFTGNTKVDVEKLASVWKISIDKFGRIDYNRK